MTVFEINKQHIIDNYNQIARRSDALVIPMLKANAYGLGANEVLSLLKDSCGAVLFAVSRIEEAEALDRAGADVIVTSCYHDDESLKYLVDNDFIMSVDSLSLAKRIGKYATECQKTARVHIKVDTGFGRFGFMPGDTDDIKEVYSTEGIKAEGIFSHFSSAFSDKKITDAQFEKFMLVCDTLVAGGVDVGIRHIANSSAVLKDKKYCLDAVRVGSALLGRVPFKTDADLKRVGTFKTTVADIRTIKKGANIGYGNIFRLKRTSRVAVLTVGVCDGVLVKKDYDTFRLIDIARYGFGVFKMLFRDNRLTVKIGDKTAKTLGRVALTHTFVDVTDIDCTAGDTAVLEISPLYVAEKVKRVYTDV